LGIRSVLLTESVDYARLPASVGIRRQLEDDATTLPQTGPGAADVCCAVESARPVKDKSRKRLVPILAAGELIQCLVFAGCPRR
jgi:hypothetical protein